MKSFVFSKAIAYNLFVYSSPLSEKKALKVSDLFSDHMVLQQEKGNFFGNQLPGKNLTIPATWETFN